MHNTTIEYKRNQQHIMPKLLIKDKLLELWEATQKEFTLRMEINDLLKAWVEKNRKFRKGQMVFIYSILTHEKVGKGIVDDAKTFIDFDPLTLNRYKSHAGEFDHDLNWIRYQIYAVKADGTKSLKHFFESPHYISDNNNDKYSDYYIRAIS